MSLFRCRILLTLLLCLTVRGFAAEGTEVPPITIFTAASLSDTLEEIGSIFTKKTGIPVFSVSTT